MFKSNWLAATVVAIFVLGCASPKEPAEQAVTKIDVALRNVHEAAAKYVPERLQSVEAQIATLKDNLSKGNYKKVLADAPAATTAVADLQQAAIAKQEERDTKLAQTKQQWRALGADVPKMVAAIQARIDTLTKLRRLPRGVSKASVESAKAALASVNSTWTEATAKVAHEDYEDAVAKGREAKDKATEIMHELSMTLT